MKLGHPSTSAGTHSLRPPLPCSFLCSSRRGGLAGQEKGAYSLEQHAVRESGTVGRQWPGSGDTGSGRWGKSRALFTVLTPKATESSGASRILYNQSLAASLEPRTDLKTVTWVTYTALPRFGITRLPPPTLEVMLQTAALPLPHVTLSRRATKPENSLTVSRWELCR